MQSDLRKIEIFSKDIEDLKGYARPLGVILQLCLLLEERPLKHHNTVCYLHAHDESLSL